MHFRYRCTSWLALATLLLTVVWIVMLAFGESQYGPFNEVPRILAYYRRAPFVFSAIYLACGVLTLLTPLWLAALYMEFKDEHPLGAILGIILVPVYASLNAVVYFSQVGVMAGLARAPEFPPAVLVHGIQLASFSMMSFINVLAYAVLGVPSGFFGYFAFKRSGVLRIAGVLLGLSGVGSWVTVFGLMARLEALKAGVVIGGVLFLASLGVFVWAGRGDLLAAVRGHESTGRRCNGIP